MPLVVFISVGRYSRIMPPAFPLAPRPPANRLGQDRRKGPPIRGLRQRKSALNGRLRGSLGRGAVEAGPLGLCRGSSRLVCRSAGADRAHPGRRGRQLAPVPVRPRVHGDRRAYPPRVLQRLPAPGAAPSLAGPGALCRGSVRACACPGAWAAPWAMSWMPTDSGFGAQVVVVALESNEEPMTVIFRASSVELAA